MWNNDADAFMKEHCFSFVQMYSLHSPNSSNKTLLSAFSFQTGVLRFLLHLHSKASLAPPLSFLALVSCLWTTSDLTIGFCKLISQSFNISDLYLPCLEQTQDPVLYFIPSTFIGLSPVQIRLPELFELQKQHKAESYKK